MRETDRSKTVPNRARFRVLRAVVVGLFPLALVGCGESAAPSVATIATNRAISTAATSTASTPAVSGPSMQRLLAYSACMRSNGVPKFPDRTSQGNLLITPSDDIDPTSPEYKLAQNACKKLSPEAAGAPGMTPAQHAKALAALTRYVHCMRKHAVPMADPFSGPNGGVGIVLPRTVDPNSQLYKQADAACKHLLPNGG